MVHVMIDGIPVEVEKGTTVLHAAKKAGIEIPTLCYIEDLIPDVIAGEFGKTACPSVLGALLQGDGK